MWALFFTSIETTGSILSMPLSYFSVVWTGVVRTLLLTSEIEMKELRPTDLKLISNIQKLVSEHVRCKEHRHKHGSEVSKALSGQPSPTQQATAGEEAGKGLAMLKRLSFILASFPPLFLSPFYDIIKS